MDGTEHFRTALQSIRLNKWRTFLTTLGIVIGVYSVTALVTLGEGARYYFGDLFSGMGSNLLFVLSGKDQSKGMRSPLMSAVRKLNLDDLYALQRRGTTFQSVNGVIMGGGTVKRQNQWKDFIVMGTNETLPDIHRMSVASGRFLSAEDVSAKRKAVVIGRGVQEALFFRENPLGKVVTVAGAKFRVIGVMGSKGQSVGMDFDNIVFIPLTVSMDLFNQEDLSRISVKASSPSNVEPAIAEIRSLLKKTHGGNEDFTVISQADMLSTFEKVAGTMQLVIIGIASISLLVGGIGIMNIMLVTVKEKTREIGIRIAVGARRTDILVQFLIESITISLLGGVTGLLLGLVSIVIFNLSVDEFQVRFTPWVFLLSFGFSVAVGVLFGVFPARRAARLNPIEALRYE
jgi:putative ABC transport system permease protein